MGLVDNEGLGLLGVPIGADVLHGHLLVAYVPPELTRSGQPHAMIIDLRHSYTSDTTWGDDNLGTLIEQYASNMARMLRLRPPITLSCNDSHFWTLSKEARGGSQSTPASHS